MSDRCVHSCKGLCSALEVAEKRERDAMEEYRQFAATCDYPDVRSLLEELIGHREEGLRLLRMTREMLGGRFETLDNITDSFT
jgi:rubrerythrin